MWKMHKCRLLLLLLLLLLPFLNIIASMPGSSNISRGLSSQVRRRAGLQKSKAFLLVFLRCFVSFFGELHRIGVGDSNYRTVRTSYEWYRRYSENICDASLCSSKYAVELAYCDFSLSLNCPKITKDYHPNFHHQRINRWNDERRAEKWWGISEKNLLPRSYFSPPTDTFAHASAHSICRSFSFRANPSFFPFRLPWEEEE